ncbi:MAG: hypothetical protein HZB55_14655 [Deltaproteobacteria bacterium]|nr:hypothetical protein [Deltaproteobacteria bacterium]
MKTNESFRFVVKGTPKKLLRVLAAYDELRATLEPTVRRRKTAFRVFLGLAVALSVGGAALSLWNYGFSTEWTYFPAMVAAGLLSAAVLEGLTRLSRSVIVHPRLTPTSGRAQGVMILVLCGIFGGAFLGPLVWEITVVPLPYARVALAANAGAVAASAWVLLWFQRQRALRMENAIPSEPEVRWLRETVGAVLKGLGPDVGCTMVCNPFPNLWSEQRFPNLRERGGYTYPGAQDTLLDLGLDFGEGHHFRLVVTTAQINKIKNRKSKYKGTKYRTRCVFSFARSGAPAWEGARVETLRRRLQERLRPEERQPPARTLPPLTTYAPSPGATLATKVRKKGEAIEVVLTAKVADTSQGKGSLFVDPDFAAAAATTAAEVLSDGAGSGAGEGAP